MKATYNQETRELIVTSEEIEKFKIIIPSQCDVNDYWNTVTGRDGIMLYDINLFDYGEGFELQYVNLVDDSDGGLECGDDYQLADLTVI
jgi:hypothetical protein